MSWAGCSSPAWGWPDDADFPLAWLTRIPAAILFDRHNGRCVLVAESGRHALIDSMARDLAQALPPVPALPALAVLQEDDPAAFLAGVARIQDYIRAGDVFQVNLSRGWQAEFGAPVAPASLFARLMQKNPAPFSALLQMDEWAIVSSSPERLVRLDPQRPRWKPGRLPAPIPEAKTLWKTLRCAHACRRIPRNAPNTSCWSTWSATIWGGCANPAA